MLPVDMLLDAIEEDLPAKGEVEFDEVCHLGVCWGTTHEALWDLCEGLKWGLQPRTIFSRPA